MITLELVVKALWVAQDIFSLIGMLPFRDLYIILGAEFNWIPTDYGLKFAIAEHHGRAWVPHFVCFEGCPFKFDRERGGEAIVENP